MTPITLPTDPYLGVVANELLTELYSSGFIAQMIAPEFPVDVAAGKYPYIPLEVWLSRPTQTRRFPRGAYPETNVHFEEKTFYTADYGEMDTVDDTTRNLYKHLLDPAAITTKRLILRMQRAFEHQVQEMTQVVGNAGGTHVAAKAFSDVTSEPINELRSGIASMLSKIGVEPNAIVISKNTLRNIMNTNQVLDVMKYTNPVSMQPEQAQANILAQAISVPQIIIGNAFTNTKQEGQAGVMGTIWKDDIINLLYIDSSNDLARPTFSRTMRWTKEAPQPYMVESWYDPEIRGDRVRVRTYRQPQTVEIRCNYLLTGV